MLGSLRFRLPALFLLGIVLAGVVATLIAIRFFQSYEHSRAIGELRSESVGIVRLYARQAGASEVPVPNLEHALGGDRVFYVPLAPGFRLFTGPLPQLPQSIVSIADLESRGMDIAVTDCPCAAVVERLTDMTRLSMVRGSVVEAPCGFKKFY